MALSHVNPGDQVMASHINGIVDQVNSDAGTVANLQSQINNLQNQVNTLQNKINQLNSAATDQNISSDGNGNLNIQGIYDIAALRF